MSRGPAAIPFFGDAYLADTQHLTTEEHGSYFLLMLAAWRQDDCGLPLDERKLARIAGLTPRKWSSIQETILEFWKVENGRIYQPRLLKEWHFVRQKSESNRKSAEARWSNQTTENNESGKCGRISERNAPPPPPLKVEEPNGSPTPPTPKSKPSKKFSIPADWQPGPLPADEQAMVDLWPPGRLKTEIADFRDYWTENGEKRPGWDRTFRSRIRTVHDRIMRDSRNGNGNRNQYPARDNRDGTFKTLERQLFGDRPEQPSGEAGRFDIGEGGSDSLLPVARARIV